MFGKDKESKEFFEVFKKKPQEQGDVKYSSKVFQREQVNPTVLPRPNQKKSQEYPQGLVPFKSFPLLSKPSFSKPIDQ